MGDPVRVLHFGKFATRSFGGIETHVRALTEGLARRGLDVVNLVYDRERRDGGLVEEDLHGVRVVTVPCHGTLASLPLAPSTRQTVRALDEREPFDIVHAHFPDPLAYVAMGAARQARRVASWHSDIVRQRMLGSLYGGLASRFGQPLDAACGATTSHLESDQLGAFRPSERVVVPYGIDLARFVRTDAIERRVATIHAITGGRPIVFAIGRHVYYKGFEDLIDAMHDVDAVLVLAGEGPLSGDLMARAAASAGAKGEIHFIGPVADAELPAWYHAATIFCMPSNETSEAFGIVQLEAMACGKPIVNCSLDNAVNVVAPADEAALTVPARSPAALAEALNRLLADPGLRERLGTAGRERVERLYSQESMIDRTLGLYTRLLGRRDAH